MRVMKIDLIYNNLSGIIPTQFWELINLKLAFLQLNQLTGSIPPEIGQLINLEWLVLNNNQLTGSIPPEIGQLLNLEYRYAIWEHKDFKVDALFFGDSGQVFPKFFKFKLKNFSESYGTGLRLNFANNVIFSFEVAHGNEGTSIYVKSGTPF